MAYTGKQLETKLYDVFTKEEAVQNSTPTAVSDKPTTSTGYFSLPAGTTAQRPSSPVEGMIRFNTDIELSEYYNGSVWKVIDSPPSISSISPEYVVNTNPSVDITISGQGFASGAIVKAVGINNSTVTAFSVAVNSPSSLVATFDGTAFVDALENYSIVVTNQSGLSATKDSALAVNASPIWTTPVGNIGTVVQGSSFSTTVVATDPDGDTVSFALSSGALPIGLAISSGGVITGTESGSDTYSSGGVTKAFTLSASDTVGNATNRNFNIIKKWADGSSSAQAATSASYIKSLTGTTTMGNYWINLNGTPVEVWCDMSTDGGGWMALWMTPSGGTSQTYRISANRNQAATAEYQNYSMDYTKRSAINARCTNTQTLVKRPGGWFRFNIYIWNSSTHTSGNFHFHQSCTATSSTGNTAGLQVGIVNYYNGGGGDFGIAGSIDHHNTTYYELNSGCAGDFLYQYGAGYKANSSFTGWGGATSGCSNADSNDFSLAVYMR